jgi:hypothetical protein
MRRLEFLSRGLWGKEGMGWIHGMGWDGLVEWSHA